jgi:hypothetical protein
LTLSVAALWLNPVGAKQIFYPMTLMMHQPINLNQVEEWSPLQLTDARGLGYLDSWLSFFGDDRQAIGAILG